MIIPDDVFGKIKERLWRVADERNWQTLSDVQKSGLYEEWLRDEAVGEVLARYLDAGSVRVYIKDTIMKPYGRERIKDLSPVLLRLGLPADSAVARVYIKPHGRRLVGGRVISWGLSRDWKDVLFSVFERAFAAPSSIPYAAVIMYPTARCQQPSYRGMIETAAERLGIERVVWYDG